MGQSGLVQLDKYGDRTHVDFHIRKLEGEHDYVQGSWNPSNGLLWSKTLPNFINGQDENANDDTIGFEPLIITTVLVRCVQLICSLTLSRHLLQLILILSTIQQL